MSTVTTPRTDGERAPTQPETPRQIADAINRIALSVQVRANRCEALIAATIDALDEMSLTKESDERTRAAYRRAVNLVDVLQEHIAPIAVDAEQGEILSARICAESVA